VIPARYRHVPVWKTYGKYRKQMKRGYSKLLYNQRNKDETIISIIKRLFGEHITSRLVRTQNRELSFRCIAYNTHRLTNLTIITWFLQSQAQAVNDGNGNGNGIRVAMDNQQQQLGNGSSHSNQKSTQSYKLFSEGKKPVDVAIELGLSERQVTRYCRA